MKSMKLLTILVVALSLMAWPESTATAGLYLTVNNQPLDSIVLEAGESCTVEIVSSSSGSYEGYIGFYDGLPLGSFTHLQTKPAAGNRAIVTQYDDGSFSGYKATADEFLQRPGVHFVFEFEARQAGETDVILAKMFKNELTSIDSVHITVTGGPMGTAFTYQGGLNDAGSPADGFYDFEFKLYNGPADGNQVGTTLDVNGLDVIAGQFAVKLDFGTDVFDGDARWLEIGVRPGELSDPCDYTTLSPRQQVTPVPYAIYAKTAKTAETAGGIPGGITGSGRTNYIAKFTDANTLGGSAIYESAGNIGIGTVAPDPRYKLTVDGGGSSYGILVNNVGDTGIQSIGTNYGLRAKGGLAVSGTGLAAGGGFNADSEGGVGVYGVATDEGDMKQYGGYFVAKGKYGVGIYAKGGSNGYAAEFDGNVIIQTGRTITPVLEITGGSDLSEQFEIRGISADIQPSAGLVVSIDPESPGDLVVSAMAYDRRVAGIISGAGGVSPGVLMGQEGSKADGKNPVALTGRVYCWADASNAPIQPGDLLTTSDTPGHAMKVKDYKRAQGAILGKAMSPLESGRGLVLVLVTLQ